MWPKGVQLFGRNVAQRAKTLPKTDLYVFVFRLGAFQFCPETIDLALRLFNLEKQMKCHKTVHL